MQFSETALRKFCGSEFTSSLGQARARNVCKYEWNVMNVVGCLYIILLHACLTMPTRICVLWQKSLLRAADLRTYERRRHTVCTVHMVSCALCAIHHGLALFFDGYCHTLMCMPSLRFLHTVRCLIRYCICLPETGNRKHCGSIIRMYIVHTVYTIHSS